MDTVLLTGATGHVGTALLPVLLANPDTRVLAVVRADDADHLARRAAKLAAAVPEGARDRLELVRGDVTAPSLGLSWADRDRVASEVTSVLHSAASVRFDMPAEAAAAQNVGSTEQMLALCTWLHEKGRLRRYDHVSTCYVAGDRLGTVLESECDVGQGFRNSYEWSKCQSEKRVNAAIAGGLPAAIHRPSVVVGDSASGHTESFNVLYWPLKLYARGWWNLVPGNPDAPIDVVPVDWVATAIGTLRRDPGTLGGTFHVAAGDGAKTIRELMEFVRPRVGGGPVRFVDQGLYRTWVRPVLGPLMRRTRRGRTIRRGGDVYLPYLAGNPTFDTQRADHFLAPRGVTPPPVLDYFERILEYALARDFGSATA